MRFVYIQIICDDITEKNVQIGLQQNIKFECEKKLSDTNLIILLKPFSHLGLLSFLLWDRN